MVLILKSTAMIPFADHALQTLIPIWILILVGTFSRVSSYEVTIELNAGFKSVLRSELEF